MYPNVQPGQSRWAKCSASGPAALQHRLAAHVHHSQALMISVFKGNQKKVRSHLLKTKYSAHLGFWCSSSRCHEMHLVVVHHLLGAPQDWSLQREFIQRALCCLSDVSHGRLHWRGGKKRLFFPPPLKWAFLPPCASLEINFQHLAAFSHDSVRLPWPGASLILLLHQRCLYLIDPPASEREREEP